MKQIDFWFSIGSTYTYLTVMRLQEIGQEAGIAFDWQPFSVRALMQKMNNVPFVGKPAKEKYMWRDVERRAEQYGFPVSFPVEYPLKNFDPWAYSARHRLWSMVTNCFGVTTGLKTQSLVRMARRRTFHSPYQDCSVALSI